MRSLAFAIALATLSALPQSPALANRHTDITVTAPWSRATPIGAPTAVGYLIIANHGTEPDRLTGVDSPAAGHVSLHQMSMAGGIMRMRPIVGGLEIAPGATISLDPNGDHLMFEGLKRPFHSGDHVPAVLHFEHAGAIETGFVVR